MSFDFTLRPLVIRQPPHLLACSSPTAPTRPLSCCPTRNGPVPPLAQGWSRCACVAGGATGRRQRQGWRRPVLARQRPLLQRLCEGEQWCAHAESYCYSWPSALCPFPSLTPCPSQQLMIYTSERRASSPAMINARMTQVVDFCWKLEGVFSYALNICINA